MTSSRYSKVAVRVSDLSAAARIRYAALEQFASRGVEATSIRDVAAEAGVSPGLVQHHFGTKSGLRDAVNEYVVSVANDALQGLRTDETLTAMGDRVTAFVRENAVAMRYIARALVEGDPHAFALFDALVDIALNVWLRPEAKKGTVHRDADVEWAAMHVVMFNLATVLFEEAINRHLPEPFFSEEQLRRWNASTTDLYRRGLYRTSRSSAASKRTRS